MIAILFVKASDRNPKDSVSLNLYETFRVRNQETHLYEEIEER